MVALAKNWTISINNAFSSSVDQQVQYREALYNWINTFRIAGWTVVSSSNSVVAGAGDNIAAPADIVWGTGGGVPRSWVVLSPPSAFWGYTAPFEVMNLLIVAENTAADTTPQAIEFRMVTNGTYTGGSPTSNPTASGGVDSQPGASTIRSTFIPWATPLTGNWASWASTQGDVVFGIKPDGVLGWRTWTMVNSFADGEPQLGYGAYRPAIFGIGSTTNGAGGSGSALSSSTNWGGGSRSFDNASLGATTAQSYAWNFTSWTSGTENTRGIPASEIFLGNNAAGSAARFFGRIVDFYGAPVSAPHNEVQDGDTDSIRLVLCAGASGGGLWVPAPAASLPIL